MNQRRRQAALVAYRAFSDVAGKGAFFLVTLVAARRLSQDAFGLFSLGTTVGWIAAVATDFGIQLHLAREVAQRPADAARLLRAWFRVRLWTAALAIASVAAGLALASPSPAFSRAILLFTLVYVVNGLIEFLHYFYRGLARSDVESTLTLVATHGDADSRARRAVVAAGRDGARARDGRFPRSRPSGTAPARKHSLRRSAANSSNLVEPSSPRDSLSSVIPIGAGIVLSALYFRIDVFLVQAWQGTTAVALYNAVFRLVEALRLFPAAVLAVALPVLFQATSRQRAHEALDDRSRRLRSPCRSRCGRRRRGSSRCFTATDTRTPCRPFGSCSSRFRSCR